MKAMSNHHSERGTRHRTARSHSAIMGAVLATLQEIGYHDLTIERVAARAGVGKATVYRWWPTKPRLVVEAIRHSLEAERRVPAPVTGDSAIVARELVRRIVDTMTSPVGRMIAAMSLDLYGDPEAERQLATILEADRTANVVIIYTLITRGDLPHDVDPHALIDMISGAALACVLVGRGPHTGLVDQLTDLVLEERLPRRTA
jgi:AcrR family transcriptional regulator